jgi:hypothetical protein
MAWQAWQEEVKYAQDRRQFMLRALHMMQNRLLSTAWEAWRSCCQSLAAGRAQAEQAFAVRQHGCVHITSRSLSSNMAECSCMHGQGQVA